MDYNKHYTTLISRSKNRVLLAELYYERHHIIPRCLGGSDTSDNLVWLTPEEHFTAHLLLVKIHPKNFGLVRAAGMMITHSNGKRNNNKLYGWLRRKIQLAASLRTGELNSSYGKPWYHDPVTGVSGKYVQGSQPNGWVRGRVSKPNTTKCSVCGNSTGKSMAKWCDEHRPKREIQTVKQPKTKRYYSDEDKITALTQHQGNIRKALYSLGLNDSGAHYTKMKELNAVVYPQSTKL